MTALHSIYLKRYSIRSMEHSAVGIFSPLWTYGVVFFLLLAVLAALVMSRVRSVGSKGRLLRYLGIFIALNLVLTELYLIFVQHTWSTQDSLPLHLCRISIPVLALALITKRQSLYEWSVLAGLPGGFYALLTPELTQGGALWMLWDYYFSHSILVIAPVLMSVYYKKVPRKSAVIRVFAYVNILSLVAFVVNAHLGSNYMYVSHKPLANNPLIIGEWPWYILVIEVVFVVHLLLLSVIFRHFPAKPNRTHNRSK